MLTKSLRDEIEQFVRQKPRTVQEIAQSINKNWRTADRYIEQISSEYGTVGVRVFREGSRGALKIVYSNSLDAIKGSTYQERLKQIVIASKNKSDFSPLDIYQFVAPEKREAIEMKNIEEDNFETILKKAQNSILFFSGNLSGLADNKRAYAQMEAKIKQGIAIKILTRVDLASQKMVHELLQFNKRVGKDVVTIRHCQQPIRSSIIDDEIVTFKETILIPSKKEERIIIYRITDKEWITWSQRIFWHLWEQSVDAQTRIDALMSLTKKKAK